MPVTGRAGHLLRPPRTAFGTARRAEPADDPWNENAALPPRLRRRRRAPAPPLGLLRGLPRPPAVRVRVQRLQARATSGARPARRAADFAFGAAGSAGYLSDGRRQVGVLHRPGPAVAGPDGGGDAAGVAHAGPARGLGGARGDVRGAARLDARPGRGGGRAARGGGWVGAAAVRGAGAVHQRAVRGAAAAAHRRPVRHRRSTLRVRVGPRLPARLPQAQARGIAVRRAAGARHDGHRAAQGRGRHRRGVWRARRRSGA